MERIVFVYTTYPSAVEAEQAGRALVERDLAACVNILPGMVSLYRWQGAIERSEEMVMIIKTRASLAQQVSLAVKEMHSYSTPAILVLPIESVDQSYLEWLLAGTQTPGGSWQRSPTGQPLLPSGSPDAKPTVSTPGSPRNRSVSWS